MTSSTKSLWYRRNMHNALINSYFNAPTHDNGLHNLIHRKISTATHQHACEYVLTYLIQQITNHLASRLLQCKTEINKESYATISTIKEEVLRNIISHCSLGEIVSHKLSCFHRRGLKFSSWAEIWRTEVLLEFLFSTLILSCSTGHIYPQRKC